MRLNPFSFHKWCVSSVASAFVAGSLILGSAAVQAAEVKEIKQTIEQNGTNLSVRANLMMADGKTMQDDMVLLTHGTLTHMERSTYAALQKNLAALGVSSLAINLSLGVDNRQGEYDCAVPHKHRHTDALQEIGVWLDWLQKQGANQVTLAGHSRGGNQTAWFVSENDSDAFEKVVLIAPAFEGPKPAEFLAKAQEMQKKGEGQSMINGIDFIYCKDAQATADAVVSYYQDQSGYHTVELLKSAKKPTLVAIGSDDDVVAGLAEAVEPLVASGKVSAVTIEDADHFFLDFANEDLAAAIAEFVAE
ncbi:alpha/beta hydrolase [Thiomicrorhabdus indica]|uniref:alpha/beta hydrolase n=1 Tax=Thiomicrorhabdus indica TaxID=2267253 RepID=UPI002AA818BE|nr:alpha/beta hydrolase [Thiomicrorhabdus indica]